MSRHRQDEFSQQYYLSIINNLVESRLCNEPELTYGEALKIVSDQYCKENNLGRNSPGSSTFRHALTVYKHKNKAKPLTRKELDGSKAFDNFEFDSNKVFDRNPFEALIKANKYKNIGEK